MGAHFYCITICEPISVKRESRGGWVEPVRKYWAHHPPSQPTIAAQLLGQPATGEPYTILIMAKGIRF
jgi:hypothetical protein